MLVEFEIEWLSEGLKISEKAKGVLSYYSDDNRIIRMARIGDKTLAVTDEMGTVLYFLPIFKLFIDTSVRLSM